MTADYLTPPITTPAPPSRPDTEEKKMSWQPIETAPKDGTAILAAIQVTNNRTGSQFWERHVIAADDETGDVDVDFDHGWHWDDYSHWMPLPEPPQ
jgi:hypothetical protein